MGAFGGFTLTNKGRNLQAKAQAGAILNYTRAAIGDGTLTGQSIVALTALISAKKTLPITKLRMIPPDRAAVGTIISNQSITTGFYFREIGIFAQDPDEGEILYAYANSGANAEYLPPAGGPDVIEKSIDMLVVVGRASQVTATIDSSLVFPTFAEMEDAIEEALASVKVPLVDSNTSTSKTEAPTADALRRTVESTAEALALKQNVLRLADNYLAASVLVNAAPDGSGRSYPDGVSMFKVSSSAGGWPTANGYVLTFRAGSGGYQIFYEMYTGAVQTDKTARQWTRSKRDSNAFWQDWARGLTEVDLKMTDNYKAPTAAITEFPEGRSVSFVGGGTGGQGSAWAAAAGATETFGFVETVRTGNAGYQTFTEMYSGTDTTATSGNRQFKRNKRDSNSFWQPFERVLDQDDLNAHAADAGKHSYWGGTTTGTGGATAALAYKSTVTDAQTTGALPDGFAMSIKIGADNAAADPMLQVNSCTTYAIRRSPTAQFAAGTLKAGQLLSVVKVGSYFLARSAAPIGTATAAQVLAGYTFQSAAVPDGGTGTAKENVAGTALNNGGAQVPSGSSAAIAIFPAGVSFITVTPEFNYDRASPVNGINGQYYLQDANGVRTPVTDVAYDSNGFQHYAIIINLTFKVIKAITKTTLGTTITNNTKSIPASMDLTKSLTLTFVATASNSSYAFNGTLSYG